MFLLNLTEQFLKWVDLIINVGLNSKSLREKIHLQKLSH